MELSLKASAADAQAGVISVADAVFAAEYKPSLIHQVVTAYLAGARSGTKAQKTRSQVSGSTVKPWRQKGTGRARAGNTRSPIWRSGGVTFAATPRSYEQKVNKKMYRGAMRSMLSELLRQERLLVVENFAVDAPKTRELVAKLKGLDVSSVLIVTEVFDEALYLASRNLYRVNVCPVGDLDPVSLIEVEHVVITQAALKQLEEKLA